MLSNLDKADISDMLDIDNDPRMFVQSFNGGSCSGLVKYSHSFACPQSIAFFLKKKYSRKGDLETYISDWVL